MFHGHNARKLHPCPRPNRSSPEGHRQKSPFVLRRKIAFSISFRVQANTGSRDPPSTTHRHRVTAAPAPTSLHVYGSTITSFPPGLIPDRLQRRRNRHRSRVPRTAQYFSVWQRPRILPRTLPRHVFPEMVWPAPPHVGSPPIPSKGRRCPPFFAQSGHRRSQNGRPFPLSAFPHPFARFPTAAHLHLKCQKGMPAQTLFPTTAQSPNLVGHKPSWWVLLGSFFSVSLLAPLPLTKSSVFFCAPALLQPGSRAPFRLKIFLSPGPLKPNSGFGNIMFPPNHFHPNQGQCRNKPASAFAPVVSAQRIRLRIESFPVYAALENAFFPQTSAQALSTMPGSPRPQSSAAPLQCSPSCAIKSHLPRTYGGLKSQLPPANPTHSSAMLIPETPPPISPESGKPRPAPEKSLIRLSLTRPRPAHSRMPPNQSPHSPFQSEPFTPIRPSRPDIIVQPAPHDRKISCPLFFPPPASSPTLHRFRHPPRHLRQAKATRSAMDADPRYVPPLPICEPRPKSPGNFHKHIRRQPALTPPPASTIPSYPNTAACPS